MDDSLLATAVDGDSDDEQLIIAKKKQKKSNAWIEEEAEDDDDDDDEFKGWKCSSSQYINVMAVLEDIVWVCTPGLSKSETCLETLLPLIFSFGQGILAGIKTR